MRLLFSVAVAVLGFGAAALWLESRPDERASGARRIEEPRPAERERPLATAPAAEVEAPPAAPAVRAAPAAPPRVAAPPPASAPALVEEFVAPRGTFAAERGAAPEPSTGSAGVRPPSAPTGDAATPRAEVLDGSEQRIRRLLELYERVGA